VIAVLSLYTLDPQRVPSGQHRLCTLPTTPTRTCLTQNEDFVSMPSHFRGTLGTQWQVPADQKVLPSHKGFPNSFSLACEYCTVCQLFYQRRNRFPCPPFCPLWRVNSGSLAFLPELPVALQPSLTPPHARYCTPHRTGNPVTNRMGGGWRLERTIHVSRVMLHSWHSLRRPRRCPLTFLTSHLR